MKKKIACWIAALLLLTGGTGMQVMAAPAVKVQLLPANDYLELPYLNDSGKKMQLRGHQNFEVDWSSAITGAWQSKLDGDRLLLLDGGFTKAISASDGRKLWEHFYYDSDLLFLDGWGQSENGTTYTIRRDISDKTFDARVDLITRDGSVKSTYSLPHDLYIFPDFISAKAMDSSDNLITVASKQIVSVSRTGSLNWTNSDVVDWRMTTSTIGEFVFTRHESNITELIVDSRDNVLVFTDLNHVYYLSGRTGEVLWDKQLDGTPKDWTASGYVRKTGQWVRAYGNPTARVEILDLATGTLTKVNKPTAAQLDLVMTKAGNGRYYVRSNRGITQIDSKGTAIWEYKLRLNGYYSVLSLLSDSKGNAYIIDNGSSVFSVDPSGKERFALIAKNKKSIHDIAVDEKGTLYLVNTETGVLVIKPKKANK